MELQPIMPIGVPIEKVVETDEESVTEVLSIWGERATSLQADAYNGVANFRFNGALKNVFEKQRIQTAYHPYLWYDRNVSARVETRDAEMFWVTRGKKLKEFAGNGFLVDMQPRVFNYYPYELVFLYNINGDDLKGYLGLPTRVQNLGATYGVFNVQLGEVSGVLLRVIADTETFEWRAQYSAQGWKFTNIPVIHTYVEAQRQTETPKAPFWVRWVNPYGGYEYWMFGNKKIRTKTLTGTNTYEKFDGRGERYIYAHEASETISVSTGIITTEQAEVMSYIVYSPCIQWFNEETEKWTEITIPRNSKFQWNDDQPTGELELTFELPTPQLIV